MKDSLSGPRIILIAILFFFFNFFKLPFVRAEIKKICNTCARLRAEDGFCSRAHCTYDPGQKECTIHIKSCSHYPDNTDIDPDLTECSQCLIDEFVIAEGVDQCPDPCGWQYSFFGVQKFCDSCWEENGPGIPRPKCGEDCCENTLPCVWPASVCSEECQCINPLCPEDENCLGDCCTPCPGYEGTDVCDQGLRCFGGYCINDTTCPIESCYPVTPTPTLPPPSGEPAILLGRIVNTHPIYASCQNFRYYFGDNCGETSCLGKPNYQVTWAQNSGSYSLDNNDCHDGLPRYTFEWTKNPLGDADGEWVDVTIEMEDGLPLKSWYLVNTNSVGKILPSPNSRQSGSFALSGPRQTIRVKVFKNGDYQWNHLWFFTDIGPWPTGSPTPIITSTPTPTSTATPTPTPVAGLWFQAIGGDIHGNSGVASKIPLTCVRPRGCYPFISRAQDGFNGLVSSGGNIDPGTGDIGEEKNWYLESEPIDFAGDYTYDYFTNQWLGEDTTELSGPDAINNIEDPGAGSWRLYKTKEAQTFNSNKFNSDPIEGAIVVLIEDNLKIESNIKLAKTGFLALIVKGDINLDETVDELQGFYLADGSFNTGTGDSQFLGKGIFVSWSGINLERDLGPANKYRPNALFEYWPRLLINSPELFFKSRIVWKEVAG